jgi:hypothetical protein
MDKFLGGNTVVLDDKSMLADRWAQEGCELVNVFSQWENDEGFRYQSIYTVTAGKTLYVSSIVATPGAIQVLFSDSDESAILSITGEDVVIVQLATPIAFTTEVNVGYAHAAVPLTIIGWEE